jgi:hypothetical protein
MALKPRNHHFLVAARAKIDPTPSIFDFEACNGVRVVVFGAYLCRRVLVL